MQYAKSARMYYYMLSDFAVCTLAWLSGNSDPQSFAQQKICHIGQCKGECVLNHFCSCFAMDIADSGSKFKAQQYTVCEDRHSTYYSEVSVTVVTSQRAEFHICVL